MIYSHPYGFCALSFALGLVLGTLGLVVWPYIPPRDRWDEILGRIEQAEDLLRQYIEGGRMQVSSSGDQLLHEVRELKELLRNRFFQAATRNTKR